MAQDLRTYHNIGNRHYYADKEAMITLMLIEVAADNPKEWDKYLTILLAVCTVMSFQRDRLYRGRPVITLETVDQATTLYEKYTAAAPSV